MPSRGAPQPFCQQGLCSNLLPVRNGGVQGAATPGPQSTLWGCHRPPWWRQHSPKGAEKLLFTMDVLRGLPPSPAVQTKYPQTSCLESWTTWGFRSALLSSLPAKKPKKKKKKKKTHEALSFRHSSVRNDTNKTQPIDQNPKQNSCPSCCSDLWWGWSWNDPQEGSRSSTWHDSLVYEVGQTRGS